MPAEVRLITEFERPQRPPVAVAMRTKPAEPRRELVALKGAGRRPSVPVATERARLEVTDVDVREERVLSERERAFEALRERDRELTPREFAAAVQRGIFIWGSYYPSTSLAVIQPRRSFLGREGMGLSLLAPDRLTLSAITRPLTAPEIMVLYEIGRASVTSSATLPTLQAVIAAVSETLSRIPTYEARQEVLNTLVAHDGIALVINDLEDPAVQLAHRLNVIERNARQEKAMRVALAKKRIEAVLDELAFAMRSAA